MKKSSLKFLLITCFCLISFVAKSQDISVELGDNNVPLNSVFTIKVTVKEGKLKNYSDFPEIEGFAKRGTSSSSSTNIINGQISSSQSITQRYLPLEEGTYKLPAFSMEVNGNTVRSGGIDITVTKPVDRPRNTRRRDPFGRSPFDDLFGNPKEDPEFVDVKEDAFLALTTDKD